MKKFLVPTVVILLATVNGIFAETPIKTLRQLDRATAEKAFEQLTKNAQKGLLAPNAVVQSKFVAIEDIYLSTPTGINNGEGGSDSPTVNIPITSGARVWFEQVVDGKPNGKLINPSMYRFSPKEEFYVHVEAAVPVFVLLYQHFPNEEGKEPKLAYPDPRFQSSYRILSPAVSTKLSTKFAMDNNHKTEHMSIVVIRADWIAQDVPAAAITAVDLAKANSPEDIDDIYRKTVKGTADISSSAVLDKFGAISKLTDWTAGSNWGDIVPQEKVEITTNWKNEEKVGSERKNQEEVIQKPELVPSVQFVYTNYRLPPPQWDGVSDDVKEVANYLFSNTGIGHLQIVLNKVEQIAP